MAEFAGSSIVVGADGSGGATRAASEAIRLSKALGGELHVVSISKSPDPQESAAAAVAAEAAAQGVSAITHTRDDDPADALLDVADKNDAAIIVVGSKGMRTGERDWFGNVPDKISHKGTASVLIVVTGDDGGGDATSGVAAADAGLSREDAST